MVGGEVGGRREEGGGTLCSVMVVGGRRRVQPAVSAAVPSPRTPQH